MTILQRARVQVDVEAGVIRRVVIISSVLMQSRRGVCNYICLPEVVDNVTSMSFFLQANRDGSHCAAAVTNSGARRIHHVAKLRRRRRGAFPL